MSVAFTLKTRTFEEWHPADAEQAFDDTLIFIDWDDTLLASGWLQSTGYKMCQQLEVPLSKEQAAACESLSSYVAALLAAAMKLGRVVIVTNGNDSWVEKSCALFMPRLMSFISAVTVVSARGRYSGILYSPTTWKRLTFCDIYDMAFVGRKGPFNIVSIGDSVSEEIAVHALADSRPNADLTKSVKLMEGPTLTQLIRQLETITAVLPTLVNHPTSLRLQTCVGAKHDGSVTPATAESS